MVNRWAVVASSATAVATALTLAAAPAGALNNAPLATTAEADAITRVHVSFGENTGGTCTGTAVSPTQILTARHCITGAESITVNGYGTAGRLPVHTTVQDDATGNDVAFLNLSEPWTGPTLPMNTDRVNTGQELEFYGMGDTGDLHTASGRVSTFGRVVGNFVDRNRSGDVLIARLRDGASAESGDSGGPIIVDGEVVAVMQSVTVRDSHQVLGAPLSTSEDFVMDHAEQFQPVGYLAPSVAPVAAVEKQPALAGEAVDGSSESAVTADAIPALGAVLAVLLALGVHNGAIELPSVDWNSA